MANSYSGTGLGPDSGLSMAQPHSFTGYSSGTMADIAARVVSEFAGENDDYFEDDLLLYRNDVGEEETVAVDENEEAQEADDGDSSDFEFQFVVPGGGGNDSPISAGEIFDNGQIKPLFSVFNTDLAFGSADWSSDLQFETPMQKDSSNSSEISAIRLPLKKLLLSERETSLTASGSCSSSDADDLEGANPETYCVWTPPKQEMSKKSKSTGSSKRWKLRNLIHRSHSDGSDKFVFLTPKQEDVHRNSKNQKAVDRSNSGGRKKDEKAPSTKTSAVGKAHRDHYLRNRAMRESDRKKSYLPYKQDLVGFFANANVLSRTMQPF